MTRPSTLLEALQTSFREALRSPEGTESPVALLWTDEESQWQDLIPLLRAAVPELYVLGTYEPALRTGPAIWLRCVLDRRLPDAAPPPGVTPILYLPGVARQHLRAGGDCAPHLLALVELQYRGVFWQQRSGREWSVESFLAAEEGVGLEMAGDARTREALRRVLAIVAQMPLDGLRDRRLDADDFDRLAVSDPVRDVLRFMSDPDAFRAGLDAARWSAFRSVCATELRLDPDDGASTAAEALVKGGGAWDRVWERFCEAPRLYRGVAALLGKVRGQGKLPFDADPRRPSANASAEASLRKELAGVAEQDHASACRTVLALEEEHGRRREWVWAQLGASPLAMALAPLARLAKLAVVPLGGASVEAIAAGYAAEGWACDRAALEALASGGSPADRSVVAGVVRAVYLPWLDASARHFQKALAERASVPFAASAPIAIDACTLFVDGLRFDAAGLLREKLEARGSKVRLTHRIAPLPTVTATAKPVAMPAADLVQGPGIADEFTPFMSRTERAASAPRLRDAMAARGVRILGPDDVAAPADDSRGWAEVGRFDELGHKLGAELAGWVDAEVDRVADRVMALLDGGWDRVRVVTDHGWLLMPGGLPRTDLPPSLVETKWARCAAVRGGSSPSVPTWPWHWRPECLVASPPGVGTFRADVEYAHGGVSPQECVVPDLVVERLEARASASIAALTWRGLRCRVSLQGDAAGLRLDIREKAGDASTSIATEAKPAAADVSLAVADDALEGHAAVVVLVDAAGTVVDRQPTIVGERT
jgi:hypothetical protein